MSKVDAIQERQRRTDENFGIPFQSQAELDRAYLLAKVKQWKRIAVRVTNERNAAESERDRLLDTVRGLADNAPLVPVHAGGGNLVNSKRMVSADDLRAALEES